MSMARWLGTLQPNRPHVIDFPACIYAPFFLSVPGVSRIMAMESAFRTFDLHGNDEDSRWAACILEAEVGAPAIDIYTAASLGDVYVVREALDKYVSSQANQCSVSESDDQSAIRTSPDLCALSPEYQLTSPWPSLIHDLLCDDLCVAATRSWQWQGTTWAGARSCSRCGRAMRGLCRRSWRRPGTAATTPQRTPPWGVCPDLAAPYS